MTSKNTICLWYDGTALEAATFYAETFPDSAVGAVHRAPGDYPSGEQGDLEAVNEIHPDVPGDERGMLKTGFDMMKGKSPEVFIDKLGKRLTFERSGVRLYEAMIAKAKALETPDSGLIDTLKYIGDEEHEHTILVHQAIESLGADPTAETPCADVVGAMALGIVSVLTDPRTNVSQCLNALLTAELADNAAWELLIELAQAAGHPEHRR